MFRFNPMIRGGGMNGFAAHIVPLALLACAASIQAADPATRPSTRPARVSQEPILAPNTVVHADVRYGDADEKLNVLDIYAPREAKNAPVLLFIHGGEWSRGDKHGVRYKPQFFNQNGVIFISTNYRLSPAAPHPAQVDDVASAIAWVHAHVAEYGGDPGKIVIMGHSAGCHLVTLVSLDPEYLAKVHLKPTDLRGVVSWSGGMFDLVDRAKGTGMYPPFIKATFGEAEAGQRAASPQTYVANAKTCPPFLFASCDDDRSKPSRAVSEEMVDQIRKDGGKAKAVLLANRVHFSALSEIGAPDDTTGAILLDFIKSATDSNVQ